MKLFYLTRSTEIADFHIIFESVDGKDIARVSGFGTLIELQKRLPKELQDIKIVKASDNHPYKRLIELYFQGDKDALKSILYKQEGTDFQKKVWDALATIPYGKTISYKNLAMVCGNTKAVRAVGTACGNNRLAVIVPCHRILRSNSILGGYLYGSEIKDYLLKGESKCKEF